MKTIAAALLIALSGKEVTEDGIKNVLKSVGAKENENEIKNVVESLKGKKPEQIITEGLKKVAHVGGAPAGGEHEEHHEEHKDEKGKGKDKGGKDKGGKDKGKKCVKGERKKKKHQDRKSVV